MMVTTKNSLRSKLRSPQAHRPPPEHGPDDAPPSRHARSAVYAVCAMALRSSGTASRRGRRLTATDVETRAAPPGGLSRAHIALIMTAIAVIAFAVWIVIR